MARHDEGLLRAALVGYEAEKTKIEAVIAQIQTQLGHRGPGRPRTANVGTEQSAPKKRRTLSASARRKIALAQKKRWAALKKQQSEPAKPKRRLSAAGRRAIVAATKKRWAAVRKAKALQAAPKKDRKSARKPAAKSTAQQAAAAPA
jgi:hypothetical protein